MRQGMLRSGLKQPMKIPKPSSPTRGGLSDLTDAATNARGAMGPPVGAKHKPSGCKIVVLERRGGSLTAQVPESAAKRQTLKDRAGEYGPKYAAPPNSRPVNVAVKQTTTNGLRGLSNSISRVPAVNISRHASASSFSGSVGYGSRPPSNNGTTRPKSAFGAINRSKSHHGGACPASSMLEHEDDEKPERKGAYPFLISSDSRTSQNLSLHYVGQRKSRDRVVSAPPVYRERPLSGTPTRASSSLLPNYAPTSPILEDPADTDCEDVAASFGALILGSSALDNRSRRMGRGMASGKDSGLSLPQSHKSNSRVFNARQPAKTSAPAKTPSRSQKRPSTPLATPYVNKYTNDRVVPVFDTESRMETMEREFAAFKQRLEGETSQASDLKDTIKVLQTRGMIVCLKR
jgi:kinesin family protein C1